MHDYSLLIITDSHADDLALRMVSSALYAIWGLSALTFTTDEVPLNAQSYNAIYKLHKNGTLTLHTGCVPNNVEANFSYSTLIARPDNFNQLLRSQRRRQPLAILDGLALQARKNEWIEAGFAASVLTALAPCPAARNFVLLPGKNYQLEEDTELFEAVLINGCRILSSDLRCYYFLRDRINWEETNFTLRQLDEVAKLPATFTPVYIHGNGDVTVSIVYEQVLEDLVQYKDQIFALGEALTLQQGHDSSGFAQLAYNGASAWSFLGQPQPGDALNFTSARITQAA